MWFGVIMLEVSATDTVIKGPVMRSVIVASLFLVGALLSSQVSAQTVENSVDGQKSVNEFNKKLKQINSGLDNRGTSLNDSQGTLTPSRPNNTSSSNPYPSNQERVKTILGDDTAD